jgi:hypothetical protein
LLDRVVDADAARRSRILLLAAEHDNGAVRVMHAVLLLGSSSGRFRPTVLACIGGSVGGERESGGQSLGQAENYPSDESHKSHN